MSKLSRKTLHVSIGLWIAFLIDGAAYSLIGQEVDAQGYLHEAFALIPIGTLLFLAASISTLVYIISRISAAKKSRIEN